MAMAESKASTPCRFLTIPPEIRDQILGEVFFPGEKQPQNLSQDCFGLASTAVRQIHPYAPQDQGRTQKLDVAVIRTCKQLQHEAEAVLYGTSSWSLMYRDWMDGHYPPAKWGLSYEFFERLPRRLRQHIRRVERKCYSEKYRCTISLHDWTLFTIFLARECPNLRSLKLWGPGDPNEAPEWVQNCLKESEWVKAILQIKTLKHFDIPVIKNGTIYDYPSFKNGFLPWIKSSLERRDRLLYEESHTELYSMLDPFPFLKLPQIIRQQIYRHVMLPRTKRIHPYIKSWYDQTTRNILPLFLSCKTIYTEASAFLYSKAIFTSPNRKYDGKLLHFLQSLKKNPHLGSQHTCVTLIRRVRVRKDIAIKPALTEFIAQNLQLKTLQVVMARDLDIQTFNILWQNKPRRSSRAKSLAMKSLRRESRPAEVFFRFPAVEIETDGSTILHPDCRAWFAAGPERETVFDQGYNYLLYSHNVWWHDWHESETDF